MGRRIQEAGCTAPPWGVAPITHGGEAAVHEGLPDQLPAIQLRGTVRTPEAFSTDAQAQALGGSRSSWGGVALITTPTPAPSHLAGSLLPIPGYKSPPRCGHYSSQDTQPCGSAGQPSPGDTGRVQHLGPHPGAHTPGGQGSSRGPLTHSGQNPRRH